MTVAILHRGMRRSSIDTISSSYTVKACESNTVKCVFLIHEVASKHLDGRCRFAESHKFDEHGPPAAAQSAALKAEQSFGAKELDARKALTYAQRLRLCTPG